MLTTEDKHATVMAFIQLSQQLPRSTWEIAVVDMSHADMNELASYATQLAIIAAELAAYLSMRGGSGCGDAGDEAAWKQVAKEHRKIRKVLGYSYPWQKLP